MCAPDAAITQYDPFSAECLSDPYPYYAWLRDEHPLYYVEAYDMWVVSRFQDVYDMLGNPELPFEAREGTVPTRAEMLVRNDGPVPPLPLQPVGGFTRIDQPHQGRLRGFINQPFRPRPVARLEDWFRDMVRADLPGVLAQGEFNLPVVFGLWTARTMCHLAGLPTEMAGDLRDAINESSAAIGNADLGLDPLDGLKRISRAAHLAVARRREAGADGEHPFVDGAINAVFEGRSLSDHEVAAQLVVPLIGGVETVPKVTSHGLWELTKNPDQLAAVRADLAATTSVAFDEMSRYCGPAQWFSRTVTAPVEIQGHRLTPGQRIIFLIQSAQRDPREFPDPDTFRWDRPMKRTLAFGHGGHFCMGMHLAKMEGRVILQEFLSAVEEFDFDDDAAVRSASSFQTGWDTLPVRIHRLADPS
ncbi:cytochrome P450 [Mycolicibacterium sp. S2-37]|uniref:cytochrome P450 n=1 Tax=Mycolicibacterium sp. S2-37 TaxID=2810297 RepID=UPI001A9414F3|nr:cytochrome P450 [Mycolicibacterium sp. S2-37]MBO0679057.1 cytochrome P450 [Mycolicibacterium sp. S2-37]